MAHKRPDRSINLVLNHLLHILYMKEFAVTLNFRGKRDEKGEWKRKKRAFYSFFSFGGRIYFVADCEKMKTMLLFSLSFFMPIVRLQQRNRAKGDGDTIIHTYTYMTLCARVSSLLLLQLNPNMSGSHSNRECTTRVHLSNCQLQLFTSFRRTF